MAEPFKSIPARLLLKLTLALYAHRGWFFWPQIILFLICVGYTVAELKFVTERSALVGADKEYHRRYMDFRKEFPAEDDMVVVVESEDAEKSRRFVDRLGAKLEAEPHLFAGVFFKGDLKKMGRKALLFLEAGELEELKQTLTSYQPFLVKFASATNLVSLFDRVNQLIATAQRGTNATNQALIKALPALERIVALATDGLQRDGLPPSPGVTALFDSQAEGKARQYLTFADGRIHLITAQARENKLTQDAIQRLRRLIADTQQEVPGLNVGLTGEPILEHDEMKQSQRDTAVASVVALVLVALIFIYGYHETGRPLKATLCLLIGLGYTMGFTTLVVGHLNILTITFVPILVGLAIDFGVHLITRYEEELRHGRSEKVALEKAMVNTGMGVFTGALTTAAAFFAMSFTDFDGIQEMGIICGGGMLVCLVPMMTLLPVLLLSGQQNVLDHELGPELESQAKAEVAHRQRIENLWLSRPWTVLGLVVVLSAAAAWAGRSVRFDYNLLHMQSAGLPAVEFQNKLIQSSSMSVLFAALAANSPAEANALTERITNLPVVASVKSMAPWLSGDPTPRLKLLGAIKDVARQIQFAPTDDTPVHVTELTQTLWSLHGYLSLARAEVKDDEPELQRNLASLQAALATLLQRLRTDDRTNTVRKLNAYQQALFTDLRETFASIRDQDDSGGLLAADLPANLRQRFIGVSGRQMLQVFPKKDIWEHAAQKEFIKALREVDPKVTGSPVQLLEYTTLLRISYEEAALYSLAAIALMVAVHFRRLSCVCLALVPVLFGSLWLVGVMGTFQIPFNPANIMTLPLMVGIGVTNGIHILNRFAEESHPSILARSTGKAVLVSGLTTIAGFGSLLLAQHRGIKSLGFIMSIGVATCMVAGLTLLPAILNLLSQYGWTFRKKKRTQRDNAQSTLGREEPRS